MSEWRAPHCAEKLSTAKAPFVDLGKHRADGRAPHCVKGVLTCVQQPTHTRRALAGGRVFCTECCLQKQCEKEPVEAGAPLAIERERDGMLARSS
jgi:hypothetical protein